MPRLARVAALAAAVAIAEAGCAGAARSRSRDLDALARESAALEADARRACEGVPLGDIASGLSGLDVVRVSVLERPMRYVGNVVEGASATIRTGGRSFDSMNLIMRCRAARAAVARDPADPFAVPGAFVRVYRDDGDAVIVQIRSRKQRDAQEIVRRLNRDVPGDDGMSATNGDMSRDTGAQDAATHLPPPARPSSGSVVPPIAGPARPTWRP